jgi:5'-nucleotidase
MKILLTNDDGVNAEGIQELYYRFKEHHDTYVIAPNEERSACSNAITTRTDLKIRKIEGRIFSVSGYPADCVDVGLHSGIIPHVDLVISGINHGPNVGNDVVFSGTVAGARTAYVFGKPGIAISMDSYHKPSSYFSDAALFLLNFIHDEGFSSSGEICFLNINYPDLPSGSIGGTIYTHLGKRVYRESYDTIHESTDELIISPRGVIDFIHNHGSDITALKDGLISITPLHNDTTDFKYLRARRKGSTG